MIIYNILSNNLTTKLQLTINFLPNFQKNQNSKNTTKILEKKKSYLGCWRVKPTKQTLTNRLDYRNMVGEEKIVGGEKFWWFQLK